MTALHTVRVALALAGVFVRCRKIARERMVQIAVSNGGADGLHPAFGASCRRRIWHASFEVICADLHRLEFGTLGTAFFILRVTRETVQ